MQDTLVARMAPPLGEGRRDHSAPPATATLGVVVSGAGEVEVHLAGRLDAGCLADVRLALLRAVSTGTGPVHLHLGAAELGDAAAVGLVVEAHQLARRCGRRLALEELTPRSERLLRAVRLLPRGRRTLGPADGPAAADAGGVAALTA